MNAPNLRPALALKASGLTGLWSMLEIYASNFCGAIAALNAIEGTIDDRKRAGMDMKSKFDSVDDLLVYLKVFRENSEGIGTTYTTTAVKRFESLLTKEQLSLDEILGNLVNIRHRFRDELMDCMLIGLDARETQEYRETIDTFEIDLPNRFSAQVEEDIDEAGKCLALDRNTACVFHLMRAMEQVLKHLALKLDIENVEKEWGKLLSEIDGKIQAMPKGKERDEWSECRANLYHVKQAWRNSTMHPKETYTNSQARDILRAVRSFMEQLAALI